MTSSKRKLIRGFRYVPGRVRGGPRAMTLIPEPPVHPATAPVDVDLLVRVFAGVLPADGFAVIHE